MKHLSKLIETYLMPLSQKLSSNKYLVALRDGLMLSMPLLIVGSLAIVIGDFPVPAFHEFMTSIVGDVWNTWCWDMVNPATMGLVALFAVHRKKRLSRFRQWQSLSVPIFFCSSRWMEADMLHPVLTPQVFLLQC